MNIDNSLSSMYIIRNMVIPGMTFSLAEAIGIKIWFSPGIRHLILGRETRGYPNGDAGLPVFYFFKKGSYK
jgi:hypothetical protein